MSTSLLRLPPLSLYVHIPWCIKKCPYCDFNSHQKNGELPETDYIEALVDDLKQDSPYIQNRKLTSIFIGGGTPSLFSAKSYAQLLEAIEKIIPFEHNIEITLEANPGTFEQQKFYAFRKTGINRLSIGIQSFQNDFLHSLGRIHGGQEALNAAKIARETGFENFNLDLMFGLPKQNINQSLKDLEIAMSFNPTHISWYQLTIEPNTHYFSQPPALPDEDLIISMHEKGKILLAEHKFNQYEISAYSQANRQAKHNVNYWQFGDYLGIGAGAHGKITLAKDNKVIRTRKTRQPNHYLNKSNTFLVETKSITQKELPLEFMMNALRLKQGSDVKTFQQTTGVPIETIMPQIQAAQARKLLHQHDIKPTTLGQQFLNDLLGHFL